MAQASASPSQPTPPAAHPSLGKRTTPWPAIIIAIVTIVPAIIGGIYQFTRDDATSSAAFGTLAWRYTGLAGAVVAAPAATADLVVLAPRDGDSIVAIETETSRLRWTAPLEGTTTSPVAADGLVYATNTAGTLFALDAATGQERWRVTAADSYMAAPAVADGVLYVGNRDGNLYALDAATGQERWRFAAGDWVDTTPAVAAGTVYLPSHSGTLFALDAATGQERWRAPLGPAGALAAPTVSSDLGIVAAIGSDGLLHVLDVATGQERWRTGGDPHLTGAPAIARDLVFAGTADAAVLALDAATGQERWHSVGGTLTPGYPPVMGSDTLYLLHDTLGIFAFDPATGALRWRYESETRGERFAPLVVAPGPAGDTLYLGSDRGLLRAIEAPTLDA